MGRNSGRIDAEPQLSPREEYRNKLVDIANVAVEPGVGDGEVYRKHIIASLEAKGYAREAIGEAFGIEVEDYRAYTQSDDYEDIQAYYLALAEASPDKAVRLAKATAFEVMGDVVRAAHRASDPSSVISAARVVLGASRVTDEDRPRITLNLTKQEITLIAESLAKLPPLPEDTNVPG